MSTSMAMPKGIVANVASLRNRAISQSKVNPHFRHLYWVGDNKLRQEREQTLRVNHNGALHSGQWSNHVNARFIIYSRNSCLPSINNNFVRKKSFSEFRGYTITLICPWAANRPANATNSSVLDQRSWYKASHGRRQIQSGPRIYRARNKRMIVIMTTNAITRIIDFLVLSFSK